ncbi:MFS transporter [Enhydrobacter sp.]|jgi:MFS family permease|uniref:MFS transporter n=1 Tax=Enhydrobacter sp. TaxID=1894999 RepID=UPI002639E939|nr:MFS transporter [Enhydrobacter sp.]WIM12708.1 MAG: putative MFS-type transporter [Enhydrobacter sp.]
MALQGIPTDVPARLDRLPWSAFHRLVVIALGITWILDGLEVTLAGSVAAALQTSPRLHLTAEQVGLTGSAYLAGAVLGALYFGHLTDRLGRKKLFNVTLGVYLLATAATAFSWNFESFLFFRFLTGAGIGGEYSAINSAIQELIPARLRGRTDLAINGSFWVGAALGAIVSVPLLDPNLFGPDLGWRIAFGSGAVLGLVILYLRQFLPESPRWLMIHGKEGEASRVVDEIEARVRASVGGPLPAVKAGLHLGAPHRLTMASVARTLLRAYPGRTALGIVLMASQAFVYNAIFFTYALVLTKFYDVAADRVGLHILPFAVGNFLGPVLLGPLFDTLGRKPMIALTYSIAGLLLAATAWLFSAGLLDATTQTVLWSIVFFFASAAASAAYLTVGESFPLEVRALTIALFYAFGTLLGGVGGPWLFGVLIEGEGRGGIVWGYALGAALMVVAALVELKLGVRAEGKSLEDVAPPLSSSD